MLRERVLTFLGDLSPGVPTAAQVAEGDALRRETAAALARYRAFVDRDVRALNVALRAAGVAAVDLAAKPAPAKPDPDADEHARRAEEH